MPESIMKALGEITDASIDDAPYGGFTAVLSTPSQDRDGDRLRPDEWDALPEKITLDVDHLMSAEGTIGSAKPYFSDDGKLMIDARFASTERAQTVRTLIQEGHLDSVSVAFMPAPSTEKDGKSKRELLNAAVVGVPSNRDAKITSVKALKALAAMEAYRKAAKDGSKKDDGPSKPYGDVEYADPGYLDAEGKPAKDPKDGQCRYPLDTASRVRTGWGYIHHEDIAGQYTATQLAHIQDKLKAAAEKLGIKIADDDDDQKSFNRVIALTGNGLTFEEVAKALDLDGIQQAEFMAVPQVKSVIEDVVAKAGARNSASDSKMIQAIHDASSILGAQCVSEAAPNEEDGSSEGANKALRHSVIVGKSLNGSLEDMQTRLQCALNDACGAGNWDGCYPWIVATYMNPDGAGGSVVYRLGGETLCRAFSDDGSCVCLDPNIQAVAVITSVAAIPDTVDGDRVMLPPAAAEASKSVNEAQISATVVPGEGMDLDQFKAALEAIPGLSEMHITTIHPTETVEKSSGDNPGSPDSPAAEASASPDSKAAPKKGPAEEDESADTDDDTETAEDEAQEKDVDAQLLRAHLFAAEFDALNLAS